MARRGRDPHWITVRHATKCARCKTDVKHGARAFYYPNERRVLCEGCGEPAAQEFAATVFDEDHNLCL